MKVKFKSCRCVLDLLFTLNMRLASGVLTQFSEAKKLFFILNVLFIKYPTSWKCRGSAQMACIMRVWSSN
jgi:hypothetical protein